MRTENIAWCSDWMRPNFLGPKGLEIKVIDHGWKSKGSSIKGRKIRI